MRLLNFTILLCLTLSAGAQDFRGGEIRVTHIEDVLVFGIDIYLYFNTDNGPGLDTVVFDNSTGAPLDTLAVADITDLGNGLQAYHYCTETQLIGVENGHLFRLPTLFDPDAVNFPSTNLITIETEFNNLLFSGWPYNEHLAQWTDFSFDYHMDENGNLRMTLHGFDEEGEVRYRPSSQLTHLSILGIYELPAPTDSLFLNGFTGEFIWYSPPGPGRYLLGFDLLEMYPGSNSVLNRFNRLIVIELTEEDFITSAEHVTKNPEINLYPNPTSDRLTIETSSLSGATHLRILSLDGREIYRAPSSPGGELHRWEVDVSAWPSGVYLVELEGEEGVVRRKVVVE